MLAEQAELVTVPAPDKAVAAAALADLMAPVILVAVSPAAALLAARVAAAMPEAAVRLAPLEPEPMVVLVVQGLNLMRPMAAVAVEAARKVRHLQ